MPKDNRHLLADEEEMNKGIKHHSYEEVMAVEDVDLDEEIKVNQQTKEKNPSMYQQLINRAATDDNFDVTVENFLVDLVNYNSAPTMTKKQLEEYIGGTRYVKKGYLDEQIRNKKSINQLYSHLISEDIEYDPEHPERMNNNIESKLNSGNHPYNNHSSFPHGNFGQELAGKSYTAMLKKYKRHFGNVPNMMGLMQQGMGYLQRIIPIEQRNKQKLLDLAKKIVMKQFKLSEGQILFDIDLVPRPISSASFQQTPVHVPIEYEDTEHREKVEKEVEKRRIINAMSNGHALNANYLFKMYDDEIDDISHELEDNYSKMLTSNELLTWMLTHEQMGQSGFEAGIVNVDLDEHPPKVIARAMAFPILIHEMVKGVMEIISMHGAPEDDKVAEHVFGKVDNTHSERWDWKMGKGIWDKFKRAINDLDYGDKTNELYTILIKAPVDKFHMAMKEILGETAKGKRLLKNMNTHVLEGDDTIEEFWEMVN